MELQHAIYLAIVAVAVLLLLTERLRNDIVALLVVIALAATGILEPHDALSGFSSEPAIVVAAIFVMTGALHITGLSEVVGGWIGRLAGSSLSRSILVIMPSVAALSAFTHHVTTTAIMVPVILNLSQQRKLPASKLLMPMSFAASLGTAITIIGAPAFLVASGILQQAGRPGLGIFSIAPIGIAITIVGTLFVLLLGRFLLPTRQGTEDRSTRFRLKDYFTEITILPDSPLVGKSIEEVREEKELTFKIVGWVRNGRRLEPPFQERRLRPGDVLLVRASPDEIVSIREETGMELHPITQYRAETPSANGAAKESDDPEDELVQVVVSPRSELVGRTLGDIDFRRRYGALVVSLWRQEGWLNEEMARIRLRSGDVLVLQGDEESLEQLSRERDFLMMVPFQGEARRYRLALRAGAIMLTTVLLTAFGVLSLEIAALAGAVAMVLTRCISARQAYRSIDVRIYVFIAGAISLGTAMQKTGTSELVAGWFGGFVAGWSPFLVCVALYTVVAIITQFMSDAATTAIFAPVAVALSAGLGQAPEAYVVTVAMGAVTALLTPIGHHGNLLIYSPGGYKFADFVRIGAPLTVVIGAVVSFLAPIIWPVQLS
ncbi:MAG TPA: SLC13 family permease [Chloroflexota bacterium]|nr:SLC13 family permease [Chloroflexota bacterium]